MRRVFLAEFVVASLFVGGLAACGGAKSAQAAGGRSSGRAVADAAHVTLQAAAEVKTTVAMKDPSQGDIPVVTMTGSYDMASDVGKLDVVLGPRTMSEIFTKDKLYAKSPTFDGIPADKWLAVDRSGLQAHYLLRTAGNDPSAFVRQIADLTDVQAMGSDTIGLGSAKHYRGQFTADALTRDLTPDMVGEVTTMLNAVHQIFADVWVDGSGRIVRVVVSYKVDTFSSNTELDLAYPASVPAPAVPVAADTVAGTLSGGALVG